MTEAGRADNMGKHDEKIEQDRSQPDSKKGTHGGDGDNPGESDGKHST